MTCFRRNENYVKLMIIKIEKFYKTMGSVYHIVLFGNYESTSHSEHDSYFYLEIFDGRLIHVNYKIIICESES